jgi:hypothetical protein
MEIQIFESLINAINFATENSFYYVLNNLAPAIFFLIFGYFLSAFIGRFVAGLLDLLRVEEILQKYKVEDAIGGTQISPLLASAAKWYVMLLFLTFAIQTLQLSSMNIVIEKFLVFAPVVIGVGLLVIVASIIGEWVREAVLELHRFWMQKTIAEVLKWCVVILAVVVSLETIGFQMGFVREVFNTLLQGIVYGIAIAFGLAFGLGGQKDAQQMIKRTRKKLRL